MINYCINCITTGNVTFISKTLLSSTSITILSVSLLGALTNFIKDHNLALWITDNIRLVQDLEISGNDMPNQHYKLVIYSAIISGVVKKPSNKNVL